ncbi:MAG: MBL fold metallo-hydrolase [Bacteroidia bacterium]|nr:MBL fold metallo-hydrolase [Bacteroidia bacterium]
MAKLTFLGCGDAFGSGGRLYTCFLLETAGKKILIDCGVSALISMKKQGVTPSEIDAIVISHLHGDHFGGIPFFLLDARYISRRTKNLIIAGPQNIASRSAILSEALYPNSWLADRGFDLEFEEMYAGQTTSLSGVKVIPFPVVHPSGSSSFGLRIECEGKVLAYSGDTEWTDTLIPLSAQADIFVCECYKYDEQLRFHLDYQTLRANYHQLSCRKMILTHMGNEMLAKTDESVFECAFDGMVVEF